jgi:hypothetical protein
MFEAGVKEKHRKEVYTMERGREGEREREEDRGRRRSPGAYHEIAVGGTTTPVGIVPPFESGIIEYFHVWLSLGSYERVDDVTLTIVRNDGSNKPGFPKNINVRKGRREGFGPLDGGHNHDALAIVDLKNKPDTVRVSVLVEFDSP